MSLQELYAKEVRSNLKLFAWWQPGDPVAPGDVGQVDDGVFVKHEELSAKFGIDAAVEEHTIEGERAFHSKGTTTGKAGASASGVGLRLEFASEGAVIFHAAGIAEQRLQNLGAVRDQVEKHRAEFKQHRYVFVSHVWRAARFGIYVSSAAGAWMELAGPGELLQQYKLADATVSVARFENVGGQFKGRGPVLVRLYGFGWLGSTKQIQPFAPNGRAGEPEQLGELSTETT